MLYLFNTTIVPLHPAIGGATVKIRKVQIQEARSIIVKAMNNSSFTSAVGHQATAEVLSRILAVQIPMNRISVQLQYGDEVIATSLGVRLQEGKVLSAEELAAIADKITFYHYTVQP